MSAADEVNRLALMAAAGISAEVATERLSVSVLIRASREPAERALAAHLALVLGRTLRVVEREPADIHVVIGPEAADAAKKLVHVVIGDGAVTFSSSPLQQQSPPSAPPDLFLKIASCYLAGYIVNHACGGERLAGAPDPFVVTMQALELRAEDLEREIPLASVALAGGGGVANGFLWALGSTRARGRLAVCDPKSVSATNVNRCLFFDEADVGKPKALALSEKVSIEGLVIDPHYGDLSSYAKQRGAPRTLISTVDSRQARRSMRFELSQEILDASTTDISEVITFSERQPTALACLCCVYERIEREDAQSRHVAEALGVELEEARAPLIDMALAAKLARIHPQLDPGRLVGTATSSLFRQLCGEGALLTPEGEQALAPLSFVSNLAGALLVVELLRRGRPEEADANYTALDPWRPPHRRARWRKARKPHCEFCGRPEVLALLARQWSHASAGPSTGEPSSKPI